MLDYQEQFDSRGTNISVWIGGFLGEVPGVTVQYPATSASSR
jgi:hypothetical protein